MSVPAAASAQTTTATTGATETASVAPAKKEPPPPPAKPASMPSPVSKVAPLGKQHPDAPGLDRTGTPATPPAESNLPPSTAKAGEDRPLPNYEGREAAPPDAGEVLVWIPRIIFYPVYLTLEYLVRWPIVGAMTLIEKHHVLEHLERIFVYDDGRIGWYPTGFIDFGLRPSFGLHFFVNDTISEGDSLTIDGAYGGDDWYQASINTRHVIFRDDSAALTLGAQFLQRPDYPFHGVGGAENFDETFYSWRRIEAEAAIDAGLGGLNEIAFGLFFRHGQLKGGQGPSIDTLLPPTPRAGAPAMGAPPDSLIAYNTAGRQLTYRLLGAHLHLALDSRSEERDFTEGSGVRFEVLSGIELDPSNTDLSFVRLGGELAGFWDFTELEHTLALRLYADTLHKIGDTEIPFSELIMLGGTEHMRGFLEGRLRGESAVVATLDYRYPVWSLLDANLFMSFGGAFGERFEGFRWDRLFMTWGLGLRTSYSRDSSFEIMVAFGSNQAKEWSDGAGYEIDNFRFVFGINHGY